jgi:hypothetical protein
MMTNLDFLCLDQILRGKQLIAFTAIEAGLGWNKQTPGGEQGFEAAYELGQGDAHNYVWLQVNNHRFRQEGKRGDIRDDGFWKPHANLR